jgi:hypothetical protein
MYSLLVGIAVQRRIERELRWAGLDICPRNVQWWAKLPTSERNAWLGIPNPTEADCATA